MDIENLSKEELLNEIKAHGVTIHHKTGEEKLRTTLKAIIDGTYEDTMPSQETPVVEEKATAAPAAPKLTEEQKKEERRKIKERNAMALKRIVVVPNDPKLTSYPGLIFTVGSSAINGGRMIKKFVPFNNEEGWHVPQIILDQIEAAEMQKFKQTKLANGEKVLVPYMAKKFNVTVLPDLNKEELEALAASQKARGDA